MELLYMTIIGFVVGIVAKLLVFGKASGGFIVATLLGISGAVVANVIGRALNWYAEGEPASFIASIFGAVVLLIFYRTIFGRANDQV